VRNLKAPTTRVVLTDVTEAFKCLATSKEGTALDQEIWNTTVLRCRYAESTCRYFTEVRRVSHGITSVVLTIFTMLSLGTLIQPSLRPLVPRLLSRSQAHRPKSPHERRARVPLRLLTHLVLWFCKYPPPLNSQAHRPPLTYPVHPAVRRLTLYNLRLLLLPRLRCQMLRVSNPAYPLHPYRSLPSPSLPHLCCSPS
jgi:hypothetical protein